MVPSYVVFTETGLTGAFVIDLERIEDSRGFFARSWCAREFAARGLRSRLGRLRAVRTRRPKT